MKMFRWLLLSSLLLLGATSCCIHQWPEKKEVVTEGTVVLHLHFNPIFYVWPHTYDGETGTVHESYPDEGLTHFHPGTVDLYDNTQSMGMIRHVVRIYPAGEDIAYVKEIVLENPNSFAANAAQSYDCDIPVKLDPGNYNAVVWSELREDYSSAYFHNSTDFFSISLNGSEHKGNTEFRDAFRGVKGFEIISDTETRQTVEMNRPMAKYEFVATGLQDFIERETTRTRDSRAELSDYKVVFTYTNFMPSSYNAVDDRLVDSKAGVQFEGKMSQISSDEATMGFDFVMINNSEPSRSPQAVTVMVTVFDPDGEQVANSSPITVPLRRDDHTVIRSAFLSVNADGGVYIDPDYDGDHNIIM